MKKYITLCILLALAGCGKGKTQHAPQGLTDKETAIIIAKSDALDRRECAVLMQARKELMPVEIERSVLAGLSRSEAEELERESYKIDKEECLTHGISPYTKRQVDLEQDRAGPDASDHPGRMK